MVNHTKSNRAESARAGQVKACAATHHPLSRLRHREDGAFDFDLNVWAFVHGNVRHADVAAKVDV
jgi:hypothetical protein